MVAKVIIECQYIARLEGFLKTGPALVNLRISGIVP